jgi:hypothetical protein
MAAFAPWPRFPPYSATDGTGLEVLSVDHYYDGTVVIRARRRGFNNEATGQTAWWSPPAYVPAMTYASLDLGELYPPYVPRRSRFKTRFPGEARAEIPTHVHQQAPRARPLPVKRLHHFASPKVWARRNKPTPPRKDTI